MVEEFVVSSFKMRDRAKYYLEGRLRCCGGIVGSISYLKGCAGKHKEWHPLAEV